MLVYPCLCNQEFPQDRAKWGQNWEKFGKHLHLNKKSSTGPGCPTLPTAIGEQIFVSSSSPVLMLAAHQLIGCQEIHIEA